MPLDHSLIVSFLDTVTSLVAEVDNGAHAALAALAALRAQYAPADPSKMKSAPHLSDADRQSVARAAASINSGS